MSDQSSRSGPGQPRENGDGELVLLVGSSYRYALRLSRIGGAAIAGTDINVSCELKVFFEKRNQQADAKGVRSSVRDGISALRLLHRDEIQAVALGRPGGACG